VKAIRFFSVEPRTGAQTETGRAWMDDDGQLEYSDTLVRATMAPMIGRVGEEKAFQWFSDHGNGYAGSELVDDDTG